MPNSPQSTDARAAAQTAAEAKPIAAVDFALSQIERGIEDHLERKITNWFFILGMFKQAESQYLCLDDAERQVLEDKHRSVLTRLMGIGESIWSAVKCNPEFNLSISGYSRDDFSANLQYLRDRYQMWYVPVDQEVYDLVSSAIANARAAA
jgi:hypothetical protein